jgi:hypothetical protein
LSGSARSAGMLSAHSAVVETDHCHSFVVGEVPEVLQVQCCEREIADQTARCDPSVVHRARAASLLSASLQLTPADSHQLRIRQQDHVSLPLSQLGQLARPLAPQHCPLGQLANRDE